MREIFGITESVLLILAFCLIFFIFLKIKKIIISQMLIKFLNFEKSISLSKEFKRVKLLEFDS